MFMGFMRWGIVGGGDLENREFGGFEVEDITNSSKLCNLLLLCYNKSW